MFGFLFLMAQIVRDIGCQMVNTSNNRHTYICSKLFTWKYLILQNIF
jgi:hypothetical protein